MNFIIENFELIAIILFVLIIILISIVLSFNKYFAMYFSNKKFRIISSFEVDALNGRKDFSINIFNKNINDIRVSGFGYVYKGQNIDFYHSYLEDKSLPKDHKIVISSRDYLSARIDMVLLKTIISDINKGSINVEGIKAYVTDSQGLSTIAPAKQIRHQIKNLIKKDKADLKAKSKEQRRKKIEEEALFKKKTKIERSIRRKEFFGRLLLKIKGIFTSGKRKLKK